MRDAMLASFETSFANALLNADQPIPRGITAHNAAVPARRFAVYRNNVMMGLRKAKNTKRPFRSTKSRSCLLNCSFIKA